MDWTPYDSRTAFPKLYPVRCSVEKRFHLSKFGKCYMLLTLPLRMTVDLSRKDFDKSYEEKKTVTLFNPALPKLI